MDIVPIISLQIVRDRNLACHSKPWNEPTQVHELFLGIIGHSDREATWLACRDVRGHLSCLSLVSVGTISSSLISPREVYKAAILANAASIITVHNHTSGNAEPSDEDFLVTQRLQLVGALVGIKLVDHVIITPENFYSFHAEGQMETARDFYAAYAEIEEVASPNPDDAGAEAEY